MNNNNLFEQARHNIDIETECLRLLPNGRRSGKEWIALNPTRPDITIGSFSVNLTTGKWSDFSSGDAGGDIVSLVAYLRGISQYEAAKELLGENANIYYSPPIAPTIPIAKCNAQSNLQALKIWQECKAATGSLVETYLSFRGYRAAIPSFIRYHPALYHSPTKSKYPAMVAAIFRWSDKQMLGIQRTYLAEDGSRKADILPNKMMLGSVGGGAVMLARPEAGKPLVIAEGIETALSVYIATGLPTWAALSTSGMMSLEVPPLDITREIIIAADADMAGINAAKTLANRLLGSGYLVKIATPPLSMDFNDLLQKESRG